MDQDALINIPPPDLGDLRDQPELQALLANPALMNHPQIAQLYAQLQQDQANLMNLQQLPPLPPVAPLPPLQQQQDMPMNQDPMLPLQPPVAPAAAQAPPPAAAQHPLAPQFHVHMQGFMDGFAAIPVLGFAPLAPGQFPPPLRRRVAVARRPPPPPPAQPPAVPQPPQNAAGIVAGILQAAVDRAEAPAQVEGVQIHAIPVYRGGFLHPPVNGLPPLPNAGAPPVDDAMDDIGNVPLPAQPNPPEQLPQQPPQQQQPQQQQPPLQQPAFRAQMVFGGALAAVRNVLPPADAPPGAEGDDVDDDNADHRGLFRLDDPMDIAGGMGMFEDDWLRGEFGDDDPLERRRPAAANDGGAGERTPPRDVPARLEEPGEQEIHASCPICILPFKNDAEGSRTARVLSCGHLICSGCVKQFLRNLKDNRTISYPYDKAPCVVCQRQVLWRGIPECKTVGYLYEQLELTNDERSTVDEAAIAKIRTDARKRTHKLLDNISSSCHEMATKIRKLVRKADRVYDDSLERASHATGRETWRRIESEAHADAVVKVVQDESDRLSNLEILFNEHYAQLNKLLDDITSSPLNIPKEDPAKLLASDAGPSN